MMKWKKEMILNLIKTEAQNEPSSVSRAMAVGVITPEEAKIVAEWLAQKK